MGYGGTMGGSGTGGRASSSDYSGTQTRVIRLRSENCDCDEELIIEECGTKHPITVSTSSGGVVVGCTRLSWKAWDYVVGKVQASDRYR